MKINLKLQFSCLLLILISCNTNNNYLVHQGKVFGTYYKFQINSEKDFSIQIDSIFSTIGKASNSYMDSSEISTFNRNGLLLNPSPTFVDMLKEAKKYHKLSEGYFEPTLFPLIHAWGFGFKNREHMDSAKVDSLLKLVSFNNFIFDSLQVKALKKGVMIDLSALGEGYALDAITSLLDNYNINDYMIEIGGEMKCKGKNSKGEIWKIGIEDPSISIENRGASIMKIVSLDNLALSTSGNYRKFYLDSLGNRFAHIINPNTGYPTTHNLLSVSLISHSATLADAMATSCMAMGLERSKKIIERNNSIEGFLIYSENGKMKTWKSSRFPE